NMTSRCESGGAGRAAGFTPAVLCGPVRITPAACPQTGVRAPATPLAYAPGWATGPTAEGTERTVIGTWPPPGGGFRRVAPRPLAGQPFRPPPSARPPLSANGNGDPCGRTRAPSAPGPAPRRGRPRDPPPGRRAAPGPCAGGARRESGGG